MKRALSAALVACLMMAARGAAASSILFDNGSTLAGGGLYGLVSDPGGGFGGADLSALTSPEGIFGFGVNSTGPSRLADDFTVPAGALWTIESFDVFSYTTGSPSVLTATQGTVQIWNGTPGGGGSVIGGNTSTNLLSANVFTNIYRALSTTPLNDDRHIQRSTLTLAVPLVLGPGTYWMDFNLTFGAGAGFAPPMTLTSGPGVTGNARQLVSGSYIDVVDSGNAKGIPFLAVGTESSAAVPEPASLLLLGTGLVAVVRRRMKSRP